MNHTNPWPLTIIRFSKDISAKTLIAPCVCASTGSDGAAIAYLTIKSKPNDVGFSRFEWEKQIDVEDAKQLMALCPNPIHKTRWLVPAATADHSASALVWEVDEFHGRLAGRVIAELELENEQQTFAKPDFVGTEVTGLPQYYNANM